MGWQNSFRGEDSGLPKPLLRWTNSVASSAGSWIQQYASEDPTIRSRQQMILVTLSVTTFGLGVVVGRKSTRVPWRRISNWQDLPSSSISRTGAPYYRGTAVKVSDGDTLRFYHVPTWFHRSSPDPDLKISEQTWPVRVCTIDTPETPKFGKPGQPYGDEAKAALSKLVGVGRDTIHIQVLEKDQYGRAVAQVRVGWWPFRKFVDEVLLEKGFAEVYRGGGAVYGDKGLEHYNAIEAKARDKKKGMWSLGDKRESAAEYKARTK